MYNILYFYINYVIFLPRYTIAIFPPHPSVLFLPQNLQWYIHKYHRHSLLPEKFRIHQPVWEDRSNFPAGQLYSFKF